ncbi:kinase-like domain-containing protein [Gigaspora margarita]|uniref:Kinase-like domain-containing protein n=1 Tax=Gigaspora margarita TaxID=4874 RepID=A0A8H4AKR3_GIGMA|nr:kinase-like domain-containing protein [Gigaspora margarita]
MYDANTTSRQSWCSSCEVARYREKFNEWTSVDTGIDAIIRQSQLKPEFSEKFLEWIDYQKFSDEKKFLMKVISEKFILQNELGIYMTKKQSNESEVLSAIINTSDPLHLTFNNINSIPIGDLLVGVAPEVIEKHQYTKESDIYSYGKIDKKLFPNNAPFLMKVLKKCCCQSRPSDRPNIKSIFIFLKEVVVFHEFGLDTFCDIFRRELTN